MFKHNSLVASC